MSKHDNLTADQIDALIHVTRTVNTHLELDDVLRAIMTVTTEVLQAEAASLVLIDNETDELEFHVSTGEKAASLAAYRLKRGTGVVGHVIESQTPVIVTDAQSDPHFYPEVDDRTGFNTRSILCVPLIRGSEVWGAIEVLNRLDGKPFEEGDQLLCEAIAGQAAIALENAMLHKRLLTRERLAAVGETVAGLAHCVRNLLSGIEGGAYLVDVGLSENDAASIRQGWEIVRRKNAVVQDLVINMLTYSKDRTPEYEPVDVNELVSAVVDLMKDQIRDKQVRLNWQATDDMPLVTLEPKGIRRCLLNLLSNAIDACEGNEDCAISLRVLPPVKGSFVIEMEDDGCGISPMDMGRIFEPFFSTKGPHGTGLGLAVTQKIVSEHNGKLTVDSTPGEGSIFRMSLPAGTATGISPDRAEGPAVGTSFEEALANTDSAALPKPGDNHYQIAAGTRVLLVDDDPDILTFLQAALWSFDGLDVHTANNGQQGLELANKLLPDLVILDMQMPVKDGLSTFRELRTDIRTRDIPVIILTGSREQTGISLSATDVGGFVGSEPDLYLHKPIYPAVLQRKVAELLARKSAPEQNGLNGEAKTD